MRYYSRCKRCRDRREISETTFNKFLTKKLKRELEEAVRNTPGSVVGATLEFKTECPNCSTGHWSSLVEVFIGRRKLVRHH